MTGHIIAMRDGSKVALDYPDGFGRARIGRAVYRWEFDVRFGPTFVAKNGEPLRTQPGLNDGGNHMPRKHRAAWHCFAKWFKKRKGRTNG